MSPRRPISAIFPSLRNMSTIGANTGLSTAGRLMEMPSSSTANISDIRNAYSRQGLQERSLAEAARLRALKLLGATQQPTSDITRPTLITPTTATSGLRSLLPGRGTPGSAALGAFGSTMSQLGGWQDKPMTFGQILGASLGKAREAYGTAEEKQAAIAEKKACVRKKQKKKRNTLVSVSLCWMLLLLETLT